MKIIKDMQHRSLSFGEAETKNMNRKQFIKQSSIAATGILYAPAILRGLKNDEVILGHNNKRYRINTQWSQVNAAQYPVKDCHEMVQ
ncbi:MAG: hypothetical protein ACXWC7_00515, partial [Chitinophagaceae bacterium]